MLFPQTAHFMDFENPTERFCGERRSVQGFSVWGDWGFVLYHTGICAVYDLVSRDPYRWRCFGLPPITTETRTSAISITLMT